jgi:hypothetical protein
MRATLFLSALFTVSLVGGAALAERPGDDGESKRPTHEARLQDLRPREASTVREHRAPDAHAEKTVNHAPSVVKETPNRADNVDRAYKSTTTATDKLAQKDLRMGVMPVNKQLESRRNCSDVGMDCSGSTAKAKGNVSDTVQKAEKKDTTQMSRAQVQQLLAILHQQMCKNMAGACADYL